MHIMQINDILTYVLLHLIWCGLIDVTAIIKWFFWAWTHLAQYPMSKSSSHYSCCLYLQQLSRITKGMLIDRLHFIFFWRYFAVPVRGSTKQESLRYCVTLMFLCRLCVNLLEVDPGLLNGLWFYEFQMYHGTEVYCTLNLAAACSSIHWLCDFLMSRLTSSA